MGNDLELEVGANGLTHDFTFFPLLNLAPHPLSKGTKELILRPSLGTCFTCQTYHRRMSVTPGQRLPLTNRAAVTISALASHKGVSKLAPLTEIERARVKPVTQGMK